MTNSIEGEEHACLIVCGGRQRKGALDLDEWQAYESAIIAVVDPQSGKVEVTVEYETPQHLCASQSPAIVFKAGDFSNHKNRFLVCTQTEILEYDCLNWKQTFCFSHPWFNDLHHVCYGENGRMMVVNTGLDQVLEIVLNQESNELSEITNSWNVCTEDTWNRFDRDKDYRKVATTKPHLAHPNFVFKAGQDWYATRFQQQDAFRLSDSTSCFQGMGGNPHDGIVVQDQVCFTTTNGRIVAFSNTSGEILSEINLENIAEGNDALGWCRGLWMEDVQSGWVGFSRIRPTWIRKNLSWIKQGFQSKGAYGTRPTRITKFDFSNQKVLSEVNLESAGINAVFGIYSFGCKRERS